MKGRESVGSGNWGWRREGAPSRRVNSDKTRETESLRAVWPVSLGKSEGTEEHQWEIRLALGDLNCRRQKLPGGAMHSKKKL